MRGLRRVELDDALVDVRRAPLGAAAVAARRLDPDHIGAEVGEQPAGEGAEPVRRIDDQDIVKQHLNRRFQNSNHIRRHSRARPKAENPESSNPPTEPTGFRARRYAAPRNDELFDHLPLRASECTHPAMRDFAFSMSLLLKKSSGLTLSTG